MLYITIFVGYYELWYRRYKIIYFFSYYDSNSKIYNDDQNEISYFVNKIRYDIAVITIITLLIMLVYYP